jgi:hypothetical protein
VSVEFGGVIGPGATLGRVPIEAATWKLLEYTGLKPSASDPDLIVRIECITEAPPQTHNVQRWNAPIGSMELVVAYTRVRMSGSIELRPRGGEAVTATFDGTVNEPLYSAGSLSRDIDAPFGLAFRVVFLPRLMRLLTDHFGTRVLEASLKSDDEALRALAFRETSAAAISAGNFDPLVLALADPDEKISGRARTALIDAGSPALEPLLMRVGDSDPKLRVNILRTICDIGGEGAINAVVKALADPDPGVQAEAVTAVARLSYKSKVGALHTAVDPLIAMATDSSRSDRESAIRVLGMLRDRRAIEPLIRLLETDKGLREPAASALSALTGRPASTNPKVWRRYLAGR